MTAIAAKTMAWAPFGHAVHDPEQFHGTDRDERPQPVHEAGSNQVRRTKRNEARGCFW